MTTTIEWTDTTWNPTTGCDRVSPGCDNCYALKMARRLKAMGSAKYQRDGNPATSGPGFGITEHPDTLDAPLHWRDPRRVFVNSMSDVFHDGVSDEFIARVFAVMAATPQHTYQVLTKRHGRMRSLLNSHRFWLSVVNHAQVSVPTANLHYLPNVVLVVSVEDQKRADLRIPALLDTPAAVRGLSCEPLLGEVNLKPWMVFDETTLSMVIPGLHWVIVGGESGPGFRPMDLWWAEVLVNQCQAAQVPVFVKQDSGPRSGMQGQIPDELWIKEFPGTEAATA